MPVETHDEDVVALVAGGTTPAIKLARLKKSLGNQDRYLLGYPTVVYLGCFSGQSKIYGSEQCTGRQCLNKIHTDRPRTFTF